MSATDIPPASCSTKVSLGHQQAQRKQNIQNDLHVHDIKPYLLECANMKDMEQLPKITSSTLEICTNKNSFS